MSCCWSTETMQKWLPFLGWLPDYTWYALKMDFIAGISVGLTVIPQALAYAEVAGLPPQVRCLPLLLPTSFPLSLTPFQALVLIQEQSRKASYPLQTRGHPGLQSHKALFCNLEHVMAFGQTRAPITLLVTVVTHRHQVSSGWPDGASKMTHPGFKNPFSGSWTQT